MHFSFRTRIFCEDFRYSSAEHWRHVARSSCSRNRGRKEGQRGDFCLRNSDEQPRNHNLNSELVFVLGRGGGECFSGGEVVWMIICCTCSKGNVDDMALFLRVFLGFPKGMRTPWGWNIDPNFMGDLVCRMSLSMQLFIHECYHQPQMVHLQARGGCSSVVSTWDW